jgi:hypothetical protein
MKHTALTTLIAVTLTACGGDSGSSTSNTNSLLRHDNAPNSATQLTSVSTTGYLVEHDTEDMVSLPVPAYVSPTMQWQLQPQVSDDFSYSFSSSSVQTEFGDGKWYNFYHNQWDGPGATYWQHDHVSVDNGKLALRTSRSSNTYKQDKPGVNTGCISSNATVQYPVFVEASVSMADISLAAAVWLLSPDDTQEIDILEAYAGKDNGNDYFSKLIHLSHHSFIRDPFTDYQPRDRNSWWENNTTSGPLVQGNFDSWGEYSWNNGNRQYMQIGVNWINPWHFEYYINGELVRVVYANAFATKRNDEWVYSYPRVANGDLVIDGYQSVDIYDQQSGNFDFSMLESASEVSPASVIDPYDYQDGKGFHKAADIIVNMELQSWWTNDPTDAELLDTSGKTTMLVDWVRVYKPVAK